MSERLEFRAWNDPRRHVPLVNYVGSSPDHTQPVWRMSVRDWKNKLHIRYLDTYAETNHTAGHWAHINAAHGCTIYTKENNTPWKY